MHFEKVSLEQFTKDYLKCIYGSDGDIDEEEAKEILKIWENIKLPKRSTSGSSGYDFFLPYTVDFHHRKDITIPTGIRFKCDNDKFLLCIPRSGCGFKWGMALKNTVGDIDSDYYYSDNEGHIMAKIVCDEPFTLAMGKAFIQGIILPYYKVDDDNTNEVRNGGFGSTGM